MRAEALGDLARAVGRTIEHNHDFRRETQPCKAIGKLSLFVPYAEDGAQSSGFHGGVRHRFAIRRKRPSAAAETCSTESFSISASARESSILQRSTTRAGSSSAIR